MEGGTTFHFVTDGPDAALALAREAAGDRNVSITGGVTTLNAFLRAGSVDELRLHVAPFTVGEGLRVFDGVPDAADGAGVQPDHAAGHPPHLPAGLIRRAGFSHDVRRASGSPPGSRGSTSPQHLAAAGLPTFSRDADGGAVWTDPATDEPMNAEQLEALDALLHSAGDDPAHAVPMSLVQVARQARLRDGAARDADVQLRDAGRRAGTSVDATRFMIHKTASLHRLLVISDHGAT